MADHLQLRGSVVVDAGGRQGGDESLLPIGMTAVEGDPLAWRCHCRARRVGSRDRTVWPTMRLPKRACCAASRQRSLRNCSVTWRSRRWSTATPCAGAGRLGDSQRTSISLRTGSGLRSDPANKTPAFAGVLHGALLVSAACLIPMAYRQALPACCFADRGRSWRSVGAPFRGSRAWSLCETCSQCRCSPSLVRKPLRK